MKKAMMSAIIMLTIIILMVTFGFSLDGRPPVLVPPELRGHALFVCPVPTDDVWAAVSEGFGQGSLYITIIFSFAMIVLAFMWGWALYQNLLKDEFKRDSFAKPWLFTKFTFWAAVVMALVIVTPNRFRSVTVDGRSGEWVLCENTSNGAVPVDCGAVHAK